MTLEVIQGHICQNHSSSFVYEPILMKICVFTMLAFIDFFYQNRFINECARKKKAKIPESRSFLVGYRRTYVLNKLSTCGLFVDLSSPDNLLGRLVFLQKMFSYQNVEGFTFLSNHESTYPSLSCANLCLIHLNIDYLNNSTF